jgi:uncharacterized membrane protein SpoIIM required for sporulation
MIGQVTARSLRGYGAGRLVELSQLYRSACADLAMAEQYRLSPESINYLHELVGKAHNTLYRSRRFQYHLWWGMVFVQAPQQIFRDPCVHICSLLFFGLFTLSSYLAYNDVAFPGFAESLVGDAQLSQMVESFESIDFDESQGWGPGSNLIPVAGYIQHNTGIGLQCFALGPLIIPGLYTTGYNATVLGASFGYMARADTGGGDAFLEFVTAHGAFELTAIALAAAAGLRIGIGWLLTNGLTRSASLAVQGRKAIPVMAASGVLFVLAAMTEGMLSPSSVPYFVKAGCGMMSSALLMFYFVVLGYPHRDGEQGV